ncbi:MAG TPA: DUF1634 domain-containing protein [Nitrososphaerales archaeon]|nr:DUF1634 domain-containing protein [Nitrososphaerales archaeon]HUK74883.1 DUF1634 domain-containing protein [Nitrososphaerales archaeon]
MKDRVGDDELGDVVGAILRYGVLLSSVVFAAGVLLFVANPPAGASTSIQAAVGAGLGRPTLSPSSIIGGLAAGNGLSVLEVATMVLIATPVVRVSASVVLFLRERDMLYAGITALVLFMLVLGIVVIGPTQA